MSTFTDTVLTNWHLMRWVRLAFSVFIGYQAIQLHDPFAGAIAAFFLFQAVTNTGCCGSACTTTTSSNNTDTDAIEHVVYEEIKNK